MIKINFGSGPGPVPGWINVDLDPGYRPDVAADLSRDLPFATACADFLHTEDFIVALDLAGGEHFLKECRRLLRPGGVLRLLTPDLEKFARCYLERPQWLVDTWNTYVGVPLRVGTACEVMNVGLRMAGQFHYDRDTFRRLAAACGLRAEEVTYNQSRYPELCGLDLRPPEDSISMYFECHPQ